MSSQTRVDESERESNWFATIVMILVILISILKATIGAPQEELQPAMVEATTKPSQAELQLQIGHCQKQYIQCISSPEPGENQ